MIFGEAGIPYFHLKCRQLETSPPSNWGYISSVLRILLKSECDFLSAIREVSKIISPIKENIFDFIIPLGNAQWDDIVAITLFLAVSAILFHDSPLYNRNPSEKVMYECPQGTGAQIRAEKSDIIQILSREVRPSRFPTIEILFLTEFLREKDIVIIYGTQSGTSFEFAQSLSRDILAQFSKSSLVANLSDYECSSIANISSDILAIFLLSTYGGDPSDNATEFAEWIQNISGSNKLQSLRFAILGLGNSNYRFYNKFALRARQQFHNLGAKELISIQLADDGKNETQETFMSWKTEFFRAFVEDLGIPKRPRPYVPLLMLSPSEAKVDPIQVYRPITQLKASKGTDSLVFPATMSRVYNITPNASRTVFHVDLDISNEPKLTITFKCGQSTQPLRLRSSGMHWVSATMSYTNQ